jgi:hypothetical protein
MSDNHKNSKQESMKVRNQNVGNLSFFRRNFQNSSEASSASVQVGPITSYRKRIKASRDSGKPAQGWSGASVRGGPITPAQGWNKASAQGWSGASVRGGPITPAQGWTKPSARGWNKASNASSLSGFTSSRDSSITQMTLDNLVEILYGNASQSTKPLGNTRRQNNGNQKWFGFDFAFILAMNTFQEEIFRKNGILSIIIRYFNTIFNDIADVTIPSICLKSILYSQLNPWTPFTERTLDIYLNNFFELVRDRLLGYILRLPDNVTSRIIVTITLGLLHEHVYIQTMTFARGGGPQPYFKISKIASLFTEAFYVFGLNENHNFYHAFPINLPDCGDVVSFRRMEVLGSRDNQIDYWTEAFLIEVKISRNKLNTRFLNENLEMRVRAKLSNIFPLENGRTNRTEPVINLPTDKNMIITRTTGTYLAEGFYVQPQNSTQELNEFVLEFQNLSRSSTARGTSTTISTNQIRLVVNTSKSKIKLIFESVKILFSRFSGISDDRLFNFDSLMNLLNRIPEADDEQLILNSRIIEADI